MCKNILAFLFFVFAVFSARTVVAHQNALFNITDYGGTGDYVSETNIGTDNLAPYNAAVAAIDAAGGNGTIVFPAGRFRFSGDVVLGSGKNLIGFGRYGTELFFSSGSLVLGTSGGPPFNGKVSGVTIERRGGFSAIPTGSVGIKAFYYQYAVIDDCFIATHDIGIWAGGNNSLGLSIINTVVFDIKTTSLWLDSAIQTAMVDVHFGKNGSLNADPSKAFVLVSGITDTVNIAIGSFLGNSVSPTTAAFQWENFSNPNGPNNGFFQFSHLNTERVATVFRSDNHSPLINHLAVTESRLTCNGKFAEFDPATELTSLNISNNSQISFYTNTILGFIARSAFSGNIVMRTSGLPSLTFDGGSGGNKELIISGNTFEVDTNIIGHWNALVSSGNLFRFNGSTEVVYNLNTSSDSIVTSVGNRKDAGTQPNTILPSNLWIDVAPSNSWINFDVTTEQVAGYRKNASGDVELRGFLKNGTNTGNTILIPLLPAGSRPSKREYFAVAAPGGAIIRVEPSGAVRLDTPGSNNSYLSLSGIHFTPAP